MASSSDDILGDHHTTRVSSVCDRSIRLQGRPLNLIIHESVTSVLDPQSSAHIRLLPASARSNTGKKLFRALSRIPRPKGVSQRRSVPHQHFHAQGNQFNCSVSMDRTHGTRSRVSARCRRPCCVGLYHAVNFSAKTCRGGSRMSSNPNLRVPLELGRMLGSLVDLNLMALEPCSEWSAWHSCMSNLSPKPRAISQIRDK